MPRDELAGRIVLARVLWGIGGLLIGLAVGYIAWGG